VPELRPPVARESLPSAAAVIVAAAAAEQKQHHDNQDDDLKSTHDLSPLGENQASSGPQHNEQKKTDVSEHPVVFKHVGLLVNGPPGTAELSFI
jgi:hypothetical protein